MTLHDLSDTQKAPKQEPLIFGAWYFLALAAIVTPKFLSRKL